MFQKITVAVAFNHHLEDELSCAAQLAAGAELHVVHVGRPSAQKEQHLNEVLNRLKINLNGLHWLEGDKVESLLEFTQTQHIDLLITATDDTQNLFKYFTGSISKNLCRKCRCSILLLHHPVKNRGSFEHIVVSGVDHPKTAYTLEFAAKLSELTHTKKLTLVEELPVDHLVVSAGHDLVDKTVYNTKDTLMNLFDNKQEVDTLLNRFASNNLEVEIDRREGKPGYCVSAFARESHADLLVLNSPDTELGLLDRLFPHDLEYALSNLPCSLLVVHPQEFEFN